MKIKIGNFSLSEIGELSPDTLRVNGKRVIQIAQILRAPSSTVFNRKNALTAISFTVCRLHDSPRAATAYLIAHERDIPDSGIVEFISYDEGGGEESAYFPTGFLESTEGAHIGCSTVHSYNLLGGRITITKPT